MRDLLLAVLKEWDDSHCGTYADGKAMAELRTRLAQPEPAGVDDVVNEIIRDVAELPDRTSPEDWPDAMLVTADELRTILEAALRALADREQKP